MHFLLEMYFKHILKYQEILKKKFCVPLHVQHVYEVASIKTNFLCGLYKSDKIKISLFAKATKNSRFFTKLCVT
jgi:hypothetical protein